jgi:NADPH2:quinone reductase
VPVEHVVPLPPGHEAPFPGEALACAVNVARRAAVQPGERVAIVGAGFLGRAVAQLVPAELVRREDEPEAEFDVVIEAAGTQDALDKASRLVTTRGRLVLAGFHQDGPRTVDLQSWNWRGLDVINAHERDPLVYVDAMRAAVDALDPRPLVTHRFPLERLEEAFEAARTRPAGFVKAWVAP